MKPRVAPGVVNQDHELTNTPQVKKCCGRSTKTISGEEMKLKKSLKKAQLTRALIRIIREEIEHNKGSRAHSAKLRAKRLRIEKELEDL